MDDDGTDDDQADAPLTMAGIGAFGEPHKSPPDDWVTIFDPADDPWGVLAVATDVDYVAWRIADEAAS